MALISMLKKHGMMGTFKEKLSTRTILYDAASVAINGTDKTSLELVRLGEINRASKKMEQKYRTLINRRLDDMPELIPIDTLPVWTMWLQGEKEAPQIVKATLQSIKDNYPNVCIITEANFAKYVSLPSSILKKWHSKKISNAHFSDIIRTELLIKYGGTWIDSTTFVYERSANFEHKISSSPLFFFQNLRPGSMGNAIFMSSWFISSVPNEPSLVRLKELLYQYWYDNNTLSDYFLFHIFLHLIFKSHPNELKQVPKVPNSLPLQMMYELNNELSNQEIEKIFNDFPIQKLTYKNLSNNSRAVHYKLSNRE